MIKVKTNSSQGRVQLFNSNKISFEIPNTHLHYSEKKTYTHNFLLRKENLWNCYNNNINKYIVDNNPNHVPHTTVKAHTHKQKHVNFMSQFEKCLESSARKKKEKNISNKCHHICVYEHIHKLR